MKADTIETLACTIMPILLIPSITLILQLIFLTATTMTMPVLTLLMMMMLAMIMLAAITLKIIIFAESAKKTAENEGKSEYDAEMSSCSTIISLYIMSMVLLMSFTILISSLNINELTS